MLNPASPVPLYRQLAEQLRAQIDEGLYPPGARIPSEHELCDLHDLGRPTVRQATEWLVQRRLIERRRGAGTFVRERRPEIDVFSLSGTLASFERGGVELQTELLTPVTVTACESALRARTTGTELPTARTDNNQQDALLDAAENPFSGGAAYHFDRLARASGRPVLFERFFLSPRVFPDLHRHDLTRRSVSALIEDVYYLSPTGGRQTFCARLPPHAVDSALELQGLPVLLVRRTLDFPSAPGALFTELYCRTDELVFAQTIGEHS